jgi:hypothetical protein
MISANVQKSGTLPACVGIVAGSSLQPQVHVAENTVELLTEY